MHQPHGCLPHAQPAIALLSSYDGGNPGSGTALACRSLGTAAFVVSFEAATGRRLVLSEPPTSTDMAVYFRSIHQWVVANARSLTSQGKPLLHLGGDHSIAMGFWSGLLDAFPDQTLGLLWLDAHLDAHTMISSPSGHVHGMPVAGLLGLIDRQLQCVYPGVRHLSPDQLVLLGIRRYEAAEREHLEMRNVRWCPHHGTESSASITQAVVSAYHRLAACCDWVGISLDLDVFDPLGVPGVATPAPQGWPVASVLNAFRQLRGHPQWLGCEIAEYCPPNDRGDLTRLAIMDLLVAVYDVAG